MFSNKLDLEYDSAVAGAAAISGSVEFAALED
jgi:hypothetical protein